MKVKKKKKANFRKLMILNTPKDKELSKLISKFESILQSASTIIFDTDNSWCIVGIHKTRRNHDIVKSMINVIYSSAVFKGNSHCIPWLNLIYMSLDVKNMNVQTLCLLTKCHIMSSAPSEYMENIIKETDPTMYYLRIKYDDVIDLLWDTELTDTIIKDITR